MFGSLYNVTISRPRIWLESLLEHFMFSKFSWGGPPNPLINIHTIQFRTLHFQILSTPMLWPLCNCITVYIYMYEVDKYMLMCAIIMIIIIKDHKMKQIINDLPQNQPRMIFMFFNNQKCHGGFYSDFNAFILSHHQRSHICQWYRSMTTESLIIMIIK